MDYTVETSLGGVYLHWHETQCRKLEAGTAVHIHNPQQNKAQPKKYHHNCSQPQLQGKLAQGIPTPHGGMRLRQ